MTTPFRNLMFLSALTFIRPAFAQDDLDDEDAESTISGQPVGEPIMDDVEESTPDPVDSYSTRPYSDRAYEGARVLQMDVAFVEDCIQATDLLFRRDYIGAREAFEDAGARWPNSGLAPVGRTLVYQAMMLENMDFRLEAQYVQAAKQARQQLQEAMEVPGNEAWEAFIYGGILGVDAIHSVRKGQYLSALTRGFEAMRSVNRAKKLAPEFKDPLLGDGLYNYWRTVISQSVKGLPAFGDNRKLGIEQMQTVEREAIFLGPAATFALTYTWLEEGARARALSAARRNQKRYPDNVVNNMLIGRIYMYRRMYAESEASFKRVLKVSPKNQQVHYYLGRMYLRTKQLSKAEEHVDAFLEFELNDSSRSRALYAKGLIYYRRKDYDTAEQYVSQAWDVGKLQRAKRRLEKIQRMRDRTGG